MLRTTQVRIGVLIVFVLFAGSAGAGLWFFHLAHADATPPGKVEASQPSSPLAGQPAPRVDERRPLGAWERKVGPVQITLRFEAERMSGTIDVNLNENRKAKSCTFDFWANYSVTRDSILYGVITSADMKLSGVEDEEILGKVQLLLSRFHDQPFSIRFRLDGDTLVVKDIQFTFRPREDRDDSPFDAQGLAKGLAIGHGRYVRKAVATVQAGK
jgi:hypothetical protein